jgi:hypothetical protein
MVLPVQGYKALFSRKRESMFPGAKMDSQLRGNDGLYRPQTSTKTETQALARLSSQKQPKHPASIGLLPSGNF